MASLRVADPGGDRDHLGAEDLHAEDVRRLAADVLFAHEDPALHAEERRHGGRGHAVLPGARLGDDASLAHPPGKQGLAEGVVDLVGAGVVEVFALQVDPRPSELFREVFCQVQRRFPPRVLPEVIAKLLPEGLVLLLFR